MRNDNYTLTLSRIDVARRQLTGSITSLFQESDPVCVHTLAAAAREIILPIAEARGIAGSFIDKNLERFSPEKRRKFQKLMRQPQNFFKHGSGKPHESMEFDPSLSHFFLFDAVQMSKPLFGGVFVPGVVFEGWFVLHYDCFLTDDPINDEIRRVLPPEPLRSKMLADKDTLLDILSHPKKYGFPI